MNLNVTTFKSYHFVPNKYSAPFDVEYEDHFVSRIRCVTGRICVLNKLHAPFKIETLFYLG